MTQPLEGARAITKIPAQDLGRARAFYQERLGLEPVEERTGGLRYLCGATEFHVFASTGRASGASTQMGLEVEDLDAALAYLRARGVEIEQEGEAPDNYPSKGSGERGAFFRDSEGNLIGLGQATP